MEHPFARSALILVDVQRDFLPGGALGVPDGDAVVPVLNRYIEAFAHQQRPIFATRDWHPADHCSFAAQGGPWPPHCIAGSAGAGFADALHLPPETIIVSKADTPEADAYSGFEGTTLDSALKQRGIRQVHIGGLATDYCVLNTVLDALKLGYRVHLLTDAIRAVDVEPGDGEHAITRMQAAGAMPVTLGNLA